MTTMTTMTTTWTTLMHLYLRLHVPLHVPLHWIMSFLNIQWWMCSNSTVCRQDAVVVMQFIVRGENIITTIYIIITSLPKETLHISICFPLLYITLSLTLSWNATWYNHTLLQNSHYDAKVQWIILSTAFHFPIPCYLPIHYPRPLITYLFTVYGIQHKNRNNNIGI